MAEETKPLAYSPFPNLVGSLWEMVKANYPDMPFTMYPPGTCINCGYLSKREKRQGIVYYHEATGYDRATGDLWKSVNAGDSIPWCFKREAKFVQEIVDAFEGPNGPRQLHDGTKIRTISVDKDEAIRTVITRPDRDCPKFYTHQEGLLPREHFEDERMRELEELRRANDLKVAELNQRSQESMQAIMADHKDIAEITKTIAADQLALGKRADRTNGLFQWAFTALAVIAIVLAVLPLVFPNGITDLADNGDSTPSRQSTPDTAELWNLLAW